MTGAGLPTILGSLFAMLALALTPVSIEYGSGRDAPSVATAQAVSSIIIYTRWPTRPATINLCIVGPADNASRLDTIETIGGVPVSLARVAPGAVAQSRCNVLYLGQLSSAQLRDQAAWARGREVLTIAEADAGCRSQSMFCLIYLERGLTFDLNLDAISRSGLRVDPRVLRLAHGSSS